MCKSKASEFDKSIRKLTETKERKGFSKEVTVKIDLAQLLRSLKVKMKAHRIQAEEIVYKCKGWTEVGHG